VVRRAVVDAGRVRLTSPRNQILDVDEMGILPGALPGDRQRMTSIGEKL
jgi:hypothetical protein